MKLKTRILTTTILAALSGSLFAANSSLIQSPLTNTGVDGDATGRVFSSLTKGRSEFAVTAARLAPGASYELEVGGVVETTFTANRGGKANVKFRGPKPGRGLALDFDPRGQLVRILANGESVLETSLATANEPAGAIGAERVDLSPVDASATGKAKAEYRLDKKGHRSFKVELERAGAGPFELLVGGVKKGDFTAAGNSARIRFALGRDDAGAMPLDFDPRGEMIEVVRGGVVVFASELAAQAQNVNFTAPRQVRDALASTGIDPDGHAEAKLRVDARARKHFSVEIEDVPVGTYDLLVEGEVVGQIVVASEAGGGTKGEVEFTSGDDDAGELPLTFDPSGKTLAVKQGEVTYFEGTFVSDPGSGAGAPAPEPASQFEELLVSTGLDPDASARARYRVDERGRHKFSVEMGNVPAGDYTLVVADVERGVIRVTATATGTKGEIEFDTKAEPRHRPLNFDPRAQLVEIVSPAGTFFSSFLGSGTPSPSTGGQSGDDASGDDHGTGGNGGDDVGPDDGGSGGGGNDDTGIDDHGGGGGGGGGRGGNDDRSRADG